MNLNHKTIGNGKINIILLHGWGINSIIWSNIIEILKYHFTIHIIDLPGYGNNKYQQLNIEQISNIILDTVSKKAIWLGWSMGGLIATKAAIIKPKYILGLITVSSSPYLFEKKNWPGIKLSQMQKFMYQLNNQFFDTIYKFLNFQISKISYNNTKFNIIKDIHLLKKPSQKTLYDGLNLMYKNDLRVECKKINVPFLRIYGYFDNLIPYKIAYLLDKIIPKSKKIIIKNAIHAPFISHKKYFCHLLLNFKKFILNI
ncbi:MAG: pimeloyl-ACP methyl ester esterase BioH [Enterobacterales bacterium]